MTPTRKFFGDCPDTIYDYAPLSGRESYRIRGSRADALLDPRGRSTGRPMARASDPSSRVEPAHETEVRHVFGTSGLYWVLAATLSLAGVGCPGSDPAGDAYSEKRFDELLDDGRERRVPITVL